MTRDNELPQMRKLRVAIVAPSLRILGGQAVQAHRLVEAWRNDPDVEAWLIPVNPLPPGPLSHAVKIKYLRTVVTEATYLASLVRHLRRADIVHVFSASYTSFLLAPLPAMLMARAFGRPVILNYRSGQAPDHLQCSPVARRAIAGVDRTIVPSRYLVDVFSSFGLRAVAVPNVVDLARFQFRERTPLLPRILSTRNFEALYNVACTLRAFQLVQQRRPDAELTVVGGGTLDGSLRSLAGELGLRNVTFTGRVAPGEIAGHYAANDIYVQSPNIDNMPTSILEAFASGLPVVATKAGGVPAILTDREHGLLAPLDDHHALASHILQLLEHPGLAGELARNAYATCQAYTWQTVRAQWLANYQDVVSAFARQPAASPAHSL
jgi:glycosyltransferase involved in cell wall biosynthesis